MRRFTLSQVFVVTIGAAVTFGILKSLGDKDPLAVYLTIALALLLWEMGVIASVTMAALGAAVDGLRGAIAGPLIAAAIWCVVLWLMEDIQVPGAERRPPLGLSLLVMAVVTAAVLGIVVRDLRLTDASGDTAADSARSLRDSRDFEGRGIRRKRD